MSRIGTPDETPKMMNTQNNQSNGPHMSIGRQPNAIQVLSPHQPRTATASAQQPIHDGIARRALEIHVEKGFPQGQTEQIWLQAEQEIATTCP